MSAARSGYKDAKKTVTITINPNLKVVYSLDSEYILGSEIVVKGKISDFLEGNYSGHLEIVGSVNKIRMFEKKLETNGEFEYKHKTSFFDVEGNWSIDVKAKDKYGNSGSTLKTTLVKLVSEGGFYTVKFLSPAPNFVYKRGESIKLTVEVEKSGEKITNGNFTFRQPDGKLLFLKEVGPGIYSGDYKIPFDSPEGKIPLYIVGFKEVENKTIVGAAQLPINVEKTKIILELLSPGREQLVVGKMVDIIAKAAYQDGSIPENMDI